MIASNNNSPIGVFDSGVGGLTLLSKLVAVLPHESFEYYADSGHCPYGPRSIDEILDLTTKITDYLIRKDCKMIVVACNTITTNTIDKLRALYPVPFVGMEPGTKPAYLRSVNKRIGILATEGTLKGELYHKTLNGFRDQAFFMGQIGHGLVELIEKGQIDSDAMRSQLGTLLQPMIEQEVDTLVLGCTHYNYLTTAIHDIFPYPIQIIDTTDAVAEQVQRVLQKHQLAAANTGREINISTSGDLTLLEGIVQKLGLDQFGVKFARALAG